MVRKHLPVKKFLLFLTPLCLLTRLPAIQESTSEAQAVFASKLPTSGTNAYYPGNRPPLKQTALMKLPIGSIQPKGWIRQQLQLEADGFTGHLSEVSKFCKFQGSAWTDPSGEGTLGW